MKFCIEKYNRTPLFIEVFRTLIQTENVSKLDKVVELVGKSLGDRETFHHLAFALIRENKPAQAIKVLQVFVKNNLLAIEI